MDIIDQHLKETEAIVASNDQQKAKAQYNKLFSIYKDKIENFEQGTSVLCSNMNMVLNLSDGINLSTNTDYIEDLKLIVEKLKLYKQQIVMSAVINCKNNIQSQGNVTITDNSINIENSEIENSNIGHEREEKNNWKFIGGVIAALAGIAAIATLILQLCGVL